MADGLSPLRMRWRSLLPFLDWITERRKLQWGHEFLIDANLKELIPRRPWFTPQNRDILGHNSEWVISPKKIENGTRLSVHQFSLERKFWKTAPEMEKGAKIIFYFHTLAAVLTYTKLIWQFEKSWLKIILYLVYLFCPGETSRWVESDRSQAYAWMESWNRELWRTESQRKREEFHF